MSVPLKCPFKKGIIDISTEYRENNPESVFNVVLELRNLSPELTLTNLQRPFELKFVLLTKLQNNLVALGNLDLGGLKARVG